MHTCLTLHIINKLPVTDSTANVDVAVEPVVLVTTHLYMDDLVTLCKTNVAEFASLRREGMPSCSVISQA